FLSITVSGVRAGASGVLRPPSQCLIDCIEAETQRCWKIWPVSGQNAVESGIATPLRRGANRWINALNHGAEPATVCHGREPLRPSDRQDRERHNSSQTYWRRRFEPGVDRALYMLIPFSARPSRRQ